MALNKKIVPLGHVEIDYDNPFSQKLFALYIPYKQGVLEVVEQKVFFPTSSGSGSSTFDVNANGPFIDCVGNTNEVTLDRQRIVDGNNLAVTFLVSKNSASASDESFIGDGDSADYIYLDNTASRILWKISASTHVLVNSAATNDQLVWRTIARGGGLLKHYVNNTVTSASYASTSNWDYSKLLSGDGNVAKELSGKFQGVMIHERIFSDVEVYQLHDQPWQVLKKRDNRVYFLPSAGGGTTINANLESLTLTEFAATITLDKTISATQESLTLTEFSASISLGKAVAANLESLEVTEFAATIQLDKIISASLESLEITKYQATISLGTSINANTESLSLTDYNATITYSKIVNAALESLSLSEFSASVALTVEVNTPVEKPWIIRNTDIKWLIPNTDQVWIIKG